MAAKLVLSIDGRVLEEIPIAKERVTIGRKPHNDVQIDSLAIGGEHAVIVALLNDSLLEDLGSTNGTYVNGQPIQKHFLRNGDVIEMGKYKLKYVSEQPSFTSAPQGFDETMMLRPQEATAQPGSRAAASTAAVTAGALPAMPAAAIQILSGANAGKEFELTKNLTALGKSGIPVAVIARGPQGYFIAHVGGASFPAVNGTMLGARPHELKDHDVVEISGVKVKFFLTN